MIETTPGSQLPASPRWSPARRALEVVTLVLLLAPPAWLALLWHGLPAISPRLHQPRSKLWILPALSLFVYLVLSETGLLARLDVLRSGHRLAKLRPLYLGYLLTTRLELLLFFAVLGVLMDQTAATGRVTPAHGFIAASLMLIFVTIVLFIVLGTRAAYRLTRKPA